MEHPSRPVTVPPATELPSASIAAVIAAFNLHPHPEGGFFREIHRSPRRVIDIDRKVERSASTSILFLLPQGMRSRWHRVKSDEIWHFYGGAPCELSLIDPSFNRLCRTIVGPPSSGAFPTCTVEADWWQSAHSLGEYSLMGCTVAPGFEFSDFSLMNDDPEAACRLKERFPDAVAML